MFQTVDWEVFGTTAQGNLAPAICLPTYAGSVRKTAWFQNIIHFHLAPVLGKSGSIHLIPLYIFMLWRTTLPWLYYHSERLPQIRLQSTFHKLVIYKSNEMHVLSLEWLERKTQNPYEKCKI